jgi:hypothetical protein
MDMRLVNMEYVNFLLPVDRRKLQHTFRAYAAYSRRRELIPKLGIGGAHSKCGCRRKVGISNVWNVFGVYFWGAWGSLEVGVQVK